MNDRGVPPKSEWGPGPWQSEPDHKTWWDGEFACLMIRGPYGSWCGYIGVPEGHPWHGKKYDDVDASAHGGLTWSRGSDETRSPPDLPTPDSDDTKIDETLIRLGAKTYWWLGFDCAHAFDLAPAMKAMLTSRNPALPIDTHEVYRDLSYVEGEVRSLVAQAREAARDGR